MQKFRQKTFSQTKTEINTDLHDELATPKKAKVLQYS